MDLLFVRYVYIIKPNLFSQHLSEDPFMKIKILSNVQLYIIKKQNVDTLNWILLRRKNCYSR